MENDAILRQFEEIEQKVEKLIDTCKQLEATNSTLSDKVGQLEGELQGRVEEERRYAAEKTLIRSKIDSLIARLDHITEASI